MEQVIPKIIHQIWLGNRPIPNQIQQYMNSWKEHHPGWDYILWTDQNIIPLQNIELYNQITNLRQKADVLRYEVLYQYGGVYVDVDMECFKTLEPLLQNVEFLLGTEDDLYLSNELIAVIPKHELMKELIDGLNHSYLSPENKSIDEQTGPIFMTKYLLWMPQVTVAAQSILYPRLEQLNSSKRIAYTAHHAIRCKNLVR